MLRLEVRSKMAKARLFETDKTRLFVGRDQSMDLVLDDPLVSRQHAVIIARGNEFILQDLGGRNPVRVNASEVLSHRLASGDVISLGDTEVVFTDSEPSAVSPEDFSPTVLDARETIALFRRSGLRSAGGSLASTVEDDTAEDDIRGDGIRERDEIGSDTARFVDGGERSERNLRILQNFSELIRNLSDRKKLLRTVLDTIFDNLTVIRAFVGFFAPTGQLDIQEEKNQARVRRGGSSYSRTIVDRVRREGVAVLFCPTQEERIARAGESSCVGNTRSVDPRSLESKSIVRLKIKSAMCLPLFRGDDVVGVVYLDNRESSESFRTEDLYFANILSHLISLALEKEDLYQSIQSENLELKTILRHKNRMIAVSPVSREVLRKVKKVAHFDTTVLIVGESGTGKELVARAIHDRSPRRRGEPFVAVNCAAIPETLLESEMFGYAPNSGISGSDPKGKRGKFELAHTGTLFLDEIGDMSLSTQAKILRVLEERVVDRLGGQEAIPVDLRIVAATNKVLTDAVERREFREDLYYRLKVFKVDLPPLRERREDILALAHHYLSLYVSEGHAPVELSPRAKELLLAYHWPGNIRELKNCIEEALLLCRGRVIYPENLPSELRSEDNPEPFASLADLEAQHIARVLQSVNWNKRRASEILGINRSTLYEKLRYYGIEKPADRALTGSAEVGQDVI